jgi:hypothetical protein
MGLADFGTCLRLGLAGSLSLSLTRTRFGPNVGVSRPIRSCTRWNKPSSTSGGHEAGMVLPVLSRLLSIPPMVSGSQPCFELALALQPEPLRI